MLRFTPYLLVLALDIFCLIDVIVTRPDQARNLPKIAWLLLILLFPLVGSIAWLVAGRPRPEPSAGPSTPFPEYDRPGRAAGATPESDEEFLRRVRERAEEQRRKAAEEKRLRDEQGPDPDASP